MAKKEEATHYKVRLIRGASYVIPGFHFKPGVSYTVPAAKIGLLKSSQQFSIKADEDEVEDNDEGEYAGNEGGDDTDSAPARKPKKKKKR